MPKVQLSTSISVCCLQEPAGYVSHFCNRHLTLLQQFGPKEIIPFCDLSEFCANVPCATVSPACPFPHKAYFVLSSQQTISMIMPVVVTRQVVVTCQSCNDLSSCHDLSTCSDLSGCDLTCHTVVTCQAVVT